MTEEVRIVLALFVGICAGIFIGSAVYTLLR